MTRKGARFFAFAWWLIVGGRTITAMKRLIVGRTVTGRLIVSRVLMMTR
jgi:hypothetical protein